ncbi:TrwC protein, partial [mine drainage metagenome]
SATSRETAALATRSAKVLPETREAHLERWTAQAEALGIKPSVRDPAIAREARQAEGWTAAGIAGEAVQKATAHLTATEAVFRERDLHMQAARFSAGRCDWKEIEVALADAEAMGELIREPGPTVAAERLTTRGMVAAERSMADRLERGRGDHQAVMNEREFTRALARFESSRGFKLSDEQRAAACLILAGRDTFQGVQGLAGTGKTTLLAFVREAAEAKGWTVIGHSNGSEQAATMQRESGIATTTTASHLLQEQSAAQERGRASPDDVRELRIMDEASQSGQAQFNAVIESTAHAGARTVFLGDKLQHQSVEAGKAFERAQKHMPVAALGEASIRRQRTAHMKAVVHEVLAGRHSAAVRQVATIEVRAAQA